MGGAMLAKAQLKSCLAGEVTPVVPAYLFWFDGKFVEKHALEVDRMRELYTNDFIQAGPEIEKRGAEPKTEPGEFADMWGSLFRAAPDGVGAHPTRAIVHSIGEWQDYVANKMPIIDPGVFAADIKNTVVSNRDSYVVAQFWRTFYERMYMLIGFEELMIEIGTNGKLFAQMLTDLRDLTIQGIELIAEAGADAVFLADDWGTQRRLQISPAMWREYFRPAYAAMIDTAHSRGLDVWLHSCGHITEIIPDWIDIGLDVISHLQTAALDLPAIAEAYRGKITFFGGIDVQFNIVNGNRESIRQEVKALMEHFHAGKGRYIASPSNSIMPETPVENVWALFEAIREFGNSLEPER
jgi:uroporphyrinogen decarboxylase